MSQRTSQEKEEILIQLVRELGHNPLPRPPLIRKISGARYPIFRLRLKLGNEPWRAFYRLESGYVIIFGLIAKKDADRFIKTLR